MSKFLLVDANNLFFKCRYVVRGTLDEKIGMMIHIIFMSMAKTWKNKNADHIVISFDGRSWRREIYPPYKLNRQQALAKSNKKDLEENDAFFKVFDSLKNYFSDKTNVTVLYNPILESDDLIAHFIFSHPNDEHIIVSSDKDFEQLLADNVSIYNGLNDTTITTQGIYDGYGKPVVDKKTGKVKEAPNADWCIFEKCMRGCTSDNIFGAYPGIREKGSKNKVGLRDVFEDRVKQGFNWNSAMMHRWVDHNNLEHKVLDDYLRNKQLVDLKEQPVEIKQQISKTIEDGCQNKNKTQIGLYFLKLCGQYQLNKLSEQATSFSQMLNSKYKKDGI